ncbi:peptide ABC transporter permease [Methanobrevibacter sp.]|uniref:peptide ABC transporter permease n=1 Tax=Methanobrevibacter sp. TaxID=66852 RepID=UPI003865ADA6
MGCSNMDLIGGYLLIILILFAANFSLLMGNFKIDNIKLILVSFAAFVISFMLMMGSAYLNGTLSFLMDNFSYLFIALSILVFSTFLHYFRKNNLRLAIASIIILYIISVITLSSQSDLSLVDGLLYSLFVFIIVFVVYQLTKLLIHAKRDYPVIIGEYMSLFALLLFIFGLTYTSTRTLDYNMFSPFLILTPTFQLIYVIIGIIAVLIIGVVYSDYTGGNS